MQRTLDAFTGGMAPVRNRRWDYLAANPLGRAVYGEVFDGRTGPPNHVRHVFLDDRARSFFDDRPAVAHDTARILRSEAARDAHDHGPAQLIEQLLQTSADFPRHLITARRAPARRRACTASITRSWASSTSSSRPQRCEQTPA